MRDTAHDLTHLMERNSSVHLPNSAYYWMKYNLSHYYQVLFYISQMMELNVSSNTWFRSFLANACEVGLT